MKVFAAAQLLLSVVAAAQTVPLSPAQRAVSMAREQIAQEPKSAEGYNSLAKALVRRGRETGDPDFYRQAGRAVEDSFRASPDNFEGHKARVAILLARREDSAALDLAKKLHNQSPDDVQVWGMISDACLELGDYDQAENAAQWMLRLRRGNLPGMTRGAFLRIAFGDTEGALDWLTSVFKLTNATEVEERAWLLTHIARIRLETGKLELADQLLTKALQIFPEYYFTLDALAETRSAEGKYSEAVDLLRRAQKAAPHPRRLFALAGALKQAGNADEADRTFAAFEREALAIADKPDNADRELIFYYADYAHKPADAIRVGNKEIARRRDIRTLDAYGWALYSAGQYAEARAELDKALKPGIRDARLFEHAARIAGKLNDQTAAAKFERQARELRP
jgi:tetratricopeptide (TPR) repeat protein